VVPRSDALVLQDQQIYAQKACTDAVRDFALVAHANRDKPFVVADRVAQKVHDAREEVEQFASEP